MSSKDLYIARLETDLRRSKARKSIDLTTSLMKSTIKSKVPNYVRQSSNPVDNSSTKGSFSEKAKSTKKTEEPKKVPDKKYIDPKKVTLRKSEKAKTTKEVKTDRPKHRRTQSSLDLAANVKFLANKS